MMPAGKYWIGDLCYVLHERWKQVCEAMSPPHYKGEIDGEFFFDDGLEIAIFNTGIGDGEFPLHGRDGKLVAKLGVDSGTIGCVLLERIDRSVEKNDVELGAVVDIDRQFTPRADDESGVIMKFGRFVVDCAGGEEDEEDE